MSITEVIDFFALFSAIVVMGSFFAGGLGLAISIATYLIIMRVNEKGD